jgi:hypothetical protein
MATIFASYPGSSGGGSSGVLSLNGLTGALSLVAGSGITITPSGSTITISSTGGGSGTVTSVGFADASTTPIYTITGSPVTTSGTLTQTLSVQSANLIFSGPASGSPAQPSFRALVNADVNPITLMPNLTIGAATQLTGQVSLTTQVSGVLPVANGGTSLATLTANNVILGNGTSAPLFVAPGSSGHILTSNGTTWQSTAPATSGTVTSVTFTGDGTVLSSTPSSAVTTSGTLTAALAPAPAYTYLANATSSSAVPSYYPGMFGSQTISAASTTLTATSPSYNILNNSSNSVSVTLPLTSTCIGRSFYFYPVTSNAFTTTVVLNASDTVFGSAGGVSITLVSGGNSYLATNILGLQAAPGNIWLPLISPNTNLFSIQSQTGLSGELLYLTSSGVSLTSSYSAGALWQSNGTGAPSATFAPGASTPLTSVTATHSLAAGTIPTVSGGGTLGSGGTVSLGSTSFDETGQITVVAGTGATAAVVTLTYGTAYGSSAPVPNVVFSAANVATAALLTQMYVSSQGTGSFSITLGALAATTYKLNYIVKG